MTRLQPDGHAPELRLALSTGARLDRRRCLRLLAGGASGLLAACGSAAPATAVATSAVSSAPSAPTRARSAVEALASASTAPAPMALPVKTGQTAIEYWYWGSADYDTLE